MEPPAGDQHLPPTQIGAHASDIHLHRVPAQEVLNLHFPDLAHGHVALKEIVDAREDQHLFPGSLGDPHKLPDHPAGHRGHGDDDLIHLVLRDHPGQIISGAQNGAAQHSLVALQGIIIDKAHELNLVPIVVAQLPGG